MYNKYGAYFTGGPLPRDPRISLWTPMNHHLVNASLYVSAFSYYDLLHKENIYMSWFVSFHDTARVYSTSRFSLASSLCKYAVWACCLFMCCYSMIGGKEVSWHVWVTTSVSKIGISVSHRENFCVCVCSNSSVYMYVWIAGDVHLLH